MSELSETDRVTTAETFKLARERQMAGDLEDARRLYHAILRGMPNEPTCLTMLASIAFQRGEDAQADALLGRAIGSHRRALAQQPTNAGLRASLLNLLLARDRRAEAERLAGDLHLPVAPIRATPEEFVRRRRSAIERGLPSVLINTIPKAASESIWNRLAEGLGTAQCHLSLGLFPNCCLVPARVRLAAEGGLIAKEHIPATPFNVQTLAANGMSRVVIHVRDPRQATLSWAHFVRDDVAMRLMAPIWRKIVPPVGVVQADFSRLIDWCIDRYLPFLIEFIGGWLRMRDNPDRLIAVHFTSFEQFRVDPQRYFREILEFYRLDLESFAADADAEIVHLRKGLLDEWREVFVAEQQARAWKRIPPQMAETFGWRP